MLIPPKCEHATPVKISELTKRSVLTSKWIAPILVFCAAILPDKGRAEEITALNVLPAALFIFETGTIVEGADSPDHRVEIIVDGYLTETATFGITVEADDPTILPQVHASSTVIAYPGQNKMYPRISFDDNSAIDGPRTFRLRITALSGNARVRTPDVMTFTVRDDEMPGTIFLESDTGVMNEGLSNFRLNLRRFPNDPGSLSVRLRTRDDTALAGRDYQFTDQLVNFPVGVYEQSINIGGPPITPEANPLRRFKVELYNPSTGASLGIPSSATIQVNDKDDLGSSMVEYTIPDPLKLVRFVDLALDRDGVLYGLALFNLESPSAYQSKIIKFSASGVGEVLAIIPTGGIYNWADAIECGTDGKLYVCGSGFVFRYLTDGSVDPNWTNPLPSDASLQCMLPLPDGKLMIGGKFNVISGTSRPQVARLNSNGSLDTSFTMGAILPTGSTQWIYDIARDPSGRILIAGNITSLQGISRLNVVRISRDGILDQLFDASVAINNQGLSQWVDSISVAPDGKLYLAGSGKVIRVNSNGSLDTGFPRVNGKCIVQQPDGSLLVSSTNIYLEVKRYDSLGQLDGEFRPYNLSNGQMHAIALGPDGRIHCAGSFTSFDGFSLPGVATLKGGSGSVAGRIAWETPSSAGGEGIANPVAKILRQDTSSGSVGVHFTLVAETAGVGSDVEAFSGYHQFTPGETEHSISYDVLDDAILENAESFKLVLHDPVGGAALTNAPSHSVSIIDNDGNSIDSWISRFFPNNPLDTSALNTDLDGDGMTAFAEWMTDSNPLLGSDVKRPLSSWHAIGPVGAEARHFGIRFYYNPSKAGFRTIVESSSALANGSWSTIWDSVADPQMESDLIQESPNAQGGWMSVRSPDLISTREFIRVRYEGNP